MKTANEVYENSIAHLEEGVKHWGRQGFIPYGDGFDPSHLRKQFLTLSPEDASTVLTRLSDKIKEPDTDHLYNALDNFTENMYFDLEREKSTDWFDEFNTHFFHE